MTNHDDGDYGGDNDINDHGNDDNNAASGLGFNGPIFDPNTTLWILLSVVDEDQATMKMAIWPLRPIYLRVKMETKTC